MRSISITPNSKNLYPNFTSSGKTNWSKLWRLCIESFYHWWIGGQSPWRNVEQQSNNRVQQALNPQDCSSRKSSNWDRASGHLQLSFHWKNSALWFFLTTESQHFIFEPRLSHLPYELVHWLISRRNNFSSNATSAYRDGDIAKRGVKDAAFALHHGLLGHSHYEWTEEFTSHVPACNERHFVESTMIVSVNRPGWHFHLLESAKNPIKQIRHVWAPTLQCWQNENSSSQILSFWVAPFAKDS